MENKVNVELLNAKKYNFKTDDGSLIQGLKIYYYDTEIKEGSLAGEIVNNFFGIDKMEDYEKFFDELKKYYLDRKRNHKIPTVNLYFTVKSINSKPIITKIELGD